MVPEGDPQPYLGVQPVYAPSQPTSPVESPEGAPVGADAAASQMSLQLFVGSAAAPQHFFDMLTRGWLGKDMRALGRLASVSPAMRTLSDAVAHIAVTLHDQGQMIGRGRPSNGRWLAVLRELNTIRGTLTLRFNLAAAGIDITATHGWHQPEVVGTVVERPRFGHGCKCKSPALCDLCLSRHLACLFTTWPVGVLPVAITGSAVCSDAVMRTGIHYAEFTMLEDCDPEVDRLYVGVGDVSEFRENDYAHESAYAWSIQTLNGHLAHAGQLTDWPGMAPMRTQGDTIGLVLSLDATPPTISAVLNGVFRGVLCQLPDCHETPAVRDAFSTDQFCWLVTLDAEDDSSSSSDSCSRSSDSEPTPPGTPSARGDVPAHFVAVNPHARAAVRIERRAPPADLARQMSILNLSATMML